jgi:hypothetical protein
MSNIIITISLTTTLVLLGFSMNTIFNPPVPLSKTLVLVINK